MNITPGTYAPTKRGNTGRIHHVGRVVTGITNGWVQFHPVGQEQRPMETPVADFMAWAEIARVVRVS